ncbi:hypothetical protein BJ508DRAFT_150619 [Ascobolus immersus RN42]|uniref:Uncharacterized protein n=1 Tax=Ascobolus immersus RN42 TaxID=1160509 RepID=A0A3N4I3Y7_ASCIM|nr:hypothetical protein BJ508DRAFT_150619 [Ascobolus immersus RN42]
MSSIYTTRHVRDRSVNSDPAPTYSREQQSRRGSLYRPQRHSSTLYSSPSTTQARYQPDSQDFAQRRASQINHHEFSTLLSPTGPNMHRHYSPTDALTRQLSVQTHSSSSYSGSIPTRTNSTATSTSTYDDNVYHFSPFNKYDCVISVYQYISGRKEPKGSVQVELNRIRQCFKALPLGSLGTRREAGGRKIVSLFEVVLQEPVKAEFFITLLGLVHGSLSIPQNEDINYFYGLAVPCYMFRCSKEWLGDDEAWEDVRRALAKQEQPRGSTLKWIVIAAAFGWNTVLGEMTRQAILSITDEKKLEVLRLFLTCHGSNIRDVLINRRAALRDHIRATLAEKAEEFNIKWNRESHPSVHALVYQLLIGQVAGNGPLSPLETHRTSPKDTIDAHLTVIRKHLNTALQSTTNPESRLSPSIRSGGSAELPIMSNGGAVSNRNRNARSGATSRIIKDFLNTVDLKPSKSKRNSVPKQTKEDPVKARQYADMKALELCCKDLIKTFERLERDVRGLRVDEIVPRDYERGVELAYDNGSVYELEGTSVPISVMPEKPLPATPDRPQDKRIVDWIEGHTGPYPSGTMPERMEQIERTLAPTLASHARSPQSRHVRSTSYSPVPGSAEFYNDCIDDPQTSLTGHSRSASDATTPRIHVSMQPFLECPDDQKYTEMVETPRTTPDYPAFQLNVHRSSTFKSSRSFRNSVDEGSEYSHGDGRSYAAPYYDLSQNRISCITDSSFRTEYLHQPPSLSHPRSIPKQRNIPKPLKLAKKRESMGIEIENFGDMRIYRMQGCGGNTDESMLVDESDGNNDVMACEGKAQTSWLSLSPDSTPGEELSEESRGLGG